MSKTKLVLHQSLSFISASILLLILTGVAWSAEQQPTGEELQLQQRSAEEGRMQHPEFSQLDENQDGAISQKEAENWQKLSSEFSQFDKNSDQKIDRSEFSAFEPMEMEGTASKTVTVQSGDTLSTIAERVYGDANKWRLIYEANQDKIEDPNQLLAGTKLTIPSPKE